MLSSDQQICWFPVNSGVCTVCRAGAQSSAESENILMQNIKCHNLLFNKPFEVVIAALYSFNKVLG